MKEKVEHIWSQRYRPSKVSELILPDRFKKQFQAMVDNKSLQNTLLVGLPGTGKTSAALALASELDLECLFLNMSETNGIDTLRTTIRQFASTVSLNGKSKLVICDEFDGTTINFQQAFKSFIEEFSSNVIFILTANNSTKIISAIHSRMAVYHFEFTKDERAFLISEFDKRVKSILNDNDVVFDKKALAMLIVKYFPDFRKTLNELQRCCSTGQLDSSINTSYEVVEELVKYLATKNFSEMRKWCAINSDLELSTISRIIYDRAYEYLETNSIPQMVIHLAEYDYKSNFVIDKEINMCALFTILMTDCVFK